MTDTTAPQDVSAALGGAPALSVDAPEAVRAFVRAHLHWPPTPEIAGEAVADSNMNAVMRVRQSQRSVIVKQARPWVAKYPQIPAPLERAAFEANFFASIAGDPQLVAHMPRLIAYDADAHALILSDCGQAGDFRDLYTGASLTFAELESLAGYLRRLHALPLDPATLPHLQNKAMRALNAEHLFEVPLAAENPVDLDAITPGLAAEAEPMRGDEPLRQAIRWANQVYVLADRPQALLHGDFFPGSWLRTPHWPVVIDPEFGFPGPPAFDYGVALAHLILARQPIDIVARWTDLARAQVDDPHSQAGTQPILTFRFAGVEIIRRLLGVAQLPVQADLRIKRTMLVMARELLLEPEPKFLLESYGAAIARH